MDYPPFARVSSRDFFIDIWPIVIESDNTTMKLSFDEFFLVQKVIPFFSFEKYLNITRVHVHCENSCVLFLLRCIGRSITGIFFFFFIFWSDTKYSARTTGFDWEYTIVPLELKPASVMRNSINSLSSERHTGNVYTSPSMRRCVLRVVARKEI